MNSVMTSSEVLDACNLSRGGGEPQVDLIKKKLGIDPVYQTKKSAGRTRAWYDKTVAEAAIAVYLAAHPTPAQAQTAREDDLKSLMRQILGRLNAIEYMVAPATHTPTPFEVDAVMTEFEQDWATNDPAAPRTPILTAQYNAMAAEIASRRPKK